MDQRRRLQRVSNPLASQIGGGPPTQLVVDDKCEAVPGVDVAASPGLQQPGHVLVRAMLGIHVSRAFILALEDLVSKFFFGSRVSNQDGTGVRGPTQVQRREP